MIACVLALLHTSCIVVVLVVEQVRNAQKQNVNRIQCLSREQIRNRYSCHVSLLCNKLHFVSYFCRHVHFSYSKTRTGQAPKSSYPRSAINLARRPDDDSDDAEPMEIVNEEDILSDDQ